MEYLRIALFGIVGMILAILFQLNIIDGVLPAHTANTIGYFTGGTFTAICILAGEYIRVKPKNIYHLVYLILEAFTVFLYFYACPQMKDFALCLCALVFAVWLMIFTLQLKFK